MKSFLKKYRWVFCTFGFHQIGAWISLMPVMNSDPRDERDVWIEVCFCSQCGETMTRIVDLKKGRGKMLDAIWVKDQ